MNVIDPARYAADQLLAERQLAEWMGCSPKSVRNWLHRHKIEAADVPGRTKRYRAGDVQDAIRRLRSSSEVANAPA